MYCVRLANDAVHTAMRGYTGVCVGALHNVICMLPSRLGLGVGGLVGLEWVPGSPRRSKKVSSNESRWFLVFRPKVDFRCFRGYPIHIHSWVLSANFSGVALCFWATIVSCPLIFVKTENWNMCEKKVKKCRIFPYPARVSAFTRCSVGRKQLDFGMLADVGRLDKF